jgi:hypothetical protein
MHRLVRLAHMQRVGVGVGIDRDGLDPHALAGADHPAGDLAAIGDQDFRERRAAGDFGAKFSGSFRSGFLFGFRGHDHFSPEPNRPDASATWTAKGAPQATATSGHQAKTEPKTRLTKASTPIVPIAKAMWSLQPETLGVHRLPPMISRA